MNYFKLQTQLTCNFKLDIKVIAVGVNADTASVKWTKTNNLLLPRVREQVGLP